MKKYYFNKKIHVQLQLFAIMMDPSLSIRSMNILFMVIFLKLWNL